MISKEDVQEIVEAGIKKIGQGTPADFSQLPDNSKTTLVNSINEDFKAKGADIGISEPKLAEFANVEELVTWCWENQS